MASCALACTLYRSTLFNQAPYAIHFVNTRSPDLEFTAELNIELHIGVLQKAMPVIASSMNKRKRSVHSSPVNSKFCCFRRAHVTHP
jgi:hypothetical protein